MVAHDVNEVKEAKKKGHGSKVRAVTIRVNMLRISVYYIDVVSVRC